MTYYEVADKFRQCAEFAGWEKARVVDVVGMVRDLESLGPIGRLTSALSRG
jgi:hypothetical protein